MPTKEDIYGALSPAERAILEEDGFDESHLTEMAKAEAESQGDNGDDPEEEPAVEAKAAEPKTKEEAEPEDAPEPPAAEREERFRVQFEAPLPADYDAQVKSLADKRAELRAKLKEGEIDVDEFSTEDGALADQLGDLKALKAKADTFAELNQQTAAQEWEFTFKRFFKDTAKAGDIDYNADQKLRADFDRALKVLGADPEYAGKDYDFFLDEAHRIVKLKNGIVDKPAPAKKDAEMDAIAKAAAERKVDKSKIAKTLASVPGSDSAHEVGGQFTDLDGMVGMDYETAFARLSEAQKNKFLSGEA